MIHFCILSGHEGLLGSEKKIYVTLAGATELQCPTIARQLMTRRARERNGTVGSRVQQLFLTIMGATEIKAPTLAEEFVDYVDLARSGDLSLGDLDSVWAEVGRADVIPASFTLMGGFSDCELPSENDEVEGLALQRHIGNIPDDAGNALQFGIGKRGAERRASLRRAVACVLGAATA